MAELSDELIIPYYFLPHTRVSKYLILDFLFRNCSLFQKKSERLINSIHKDVISKIHEVFLISKSMIGEIFEKFLFDLTALRGFLRENKVNWYYTDPKKRYRHVKIYMHKVHRMAPIFDYGRAKKNLENLHKLLYMKNFWPHLTTQLAIVIYITDKKNGGIDLIQQNNIRAICNCSAYAFHRTRNKLELEKYL